MIFVSIVDAKAYNTPTVTKLDMKSNYHLRFSK